MAIADFGDTPVDQGKRANMRGKLDKLKNELVRVHTIIGNFDKEIKQQQIVKNEQAVRALQSKCQPFHAREHTLNLEIAKLEEALK